MSFEEWKDKVKERLIKVCFSGNKEMANAYLNNYQEDLKKWFKDGESVEFAADAISAGM